MSDKLVKSPRHAGLPMPAAHEPERFVEPDGPALDLGELLAALRRHLWIVLLLGFAGGAGGYYLVAQERTMYRSAALLRLRDTQAEVGAGALDGQESRPTTRGADPFQSELLVLKGRQVAGAVVDREGLRLFDLEQGAPAGVAADVEVTLGADAARRVVLTFGERDVVAAADSTTVRARYGEPLDLGDVRFTVPTRPTDAELTLVVVPRESAVDWLIAVVAARATEGTDAMTVTVTTPSPSLAIRVTNAVVEEYQAANAARARELNRRRRQFLEARLQETDSSLVAAQTALGRFRTRTGVYNSQVQTAAEQSGATDAEMRRKQLLAEQRIRRSQFAELERAERPTQTAAFRMLLASSEVSANPMVAQLYGRLTELETQREEMVAAGKPPAHPDVQQVANMAASTERRLVDAIRSQMSTLDARVAALGDVRAQATAEISRLTPAEGEEVRLSEQVEAMRLVGNQLRGELQRARLSEAVEMGQVEIVDPATRALALPSGGLTKLGLGLALGLFAGAAVAFLREHLDSTINRRIDVERVLRVPALAVIPQLGPAAKQGLLPRIAGMIGRPRRAVTGTARRGAADGPTVLPELVTVASARDSAAEAYRSLRTRMLFAQAGSSMRSLVVTSASVGEGKTTTAANLAVTLAQQGMRVLLVDADLRRPRLHLMFGFSNKVGLIDVLKEEATIEASVHATSVDGLFLLPSGSPSAAAGAVGPSELLGGPRMAAVLAASAERFDIVVFDTPPVLHAPDAPVIATRADAAFLVVRAGKTDRALAQDALQQLAAVGTNVIGAVLNDPDAKTLRYREHSYQYGYYAQA